MNDPSVPSADSTCHFTRLPQELRDEIYTLSFIGTISRLALSESSQVLALRPPEKIYSFILSSKQLHAECLEIFYTSVTFTAYHKESFMKRIRSMPQHKIDRIKTIHCGYAIYLPDPRTARGRADRPKGTFYGTSGANYRSRWVENRKAVAVWRLRKLEKFRLELAAEGILLKPGVLKAKVDTDGIEDHKEWTS